MSIVHGAPAVDDSNTKLLRYENNPPTKDGYSFAYELMIIK